MTECGTGNKPMRYHNAGEVLDGVRMLFFDVGNIFVSDDPSGCHCYRRLYERLGGESCLTPREFFERREQHLHMGGDLWSFVKLYVDGGDFRAFQRQTRHEIYTRWSEVSPPVPGMDAALRSLAGRYRLGLIANQPPQIEEVLRERGLWDMFEVHAISDVIGYGKPDPRIFDWALDRAELDAAQALMVGDRIDNDIRPARAHGMRTLWLQIPFAERGWEPHDEFQKCYRDSLLRTSVGARPPHTEEERPDFIAFGVADLLSALLP